MATVGGGAVDNMATNRVGCEGYILSMQSSVQACYSCAYIQRMRISDNLCKHVCIDTTQYTHLLHS